MTEYAEHSRMSASGAPAWRRCHGKIVASEGIPDNPSKYSVEGDVYHDIAAALLAPVATYGSRADPLPWGSYVGRTFVRKGFTITPDRENLEYLQVYLDEVLEASPEPDALFFVEQRVNYARFLNVPEEDGWGTADFIALIPSKRLIRVHDLKFGQGVPVYATWTDDDEVIRPNEQPLLYGLGAYADLEFISEVDEIELHIHQPRLDVHSRHSFTVEELLAEAELLAEDAAKTYPAPGYDPPLTPGPKQCKFCRAKPCAALRNGTAVTVTNGAVSSADDFDDVATAILDRRKITALSDAELGRMMDMEPLIEAFMSGIRSETDRRVLAGREVPSPRGGYALFTGKQGNREWANPLTAADLLTKAGIPASRFRSEPKLLGIAKIEKFPEVKKNPTLLSKLVALTTRAPGKPHVALKSEAKGLLPWKNVSSAEDFDAVQDAEYGFEPEGDHPFR